MIHLLKCNRELCWCPNKVPTILTSNHPNITSAPYKSSQAHVEWISAQRVYNLNVYGSAWQKYAGQNIFSILSNFPSQEIMAGKIRFSGAWKTVLLKVSSRPCNFMHLVTLQGTRVSLIMCLVVHQTKYVTERCSNAIIFCNFLM